MRRGPSASGKTKESIEMKKVLLTSCGIAAAALGGVALSAEPLRLGGTVADMTVDRMAQAAPPAGQPAPAVVEPGRPPADDPNGQAAPANQRRQATPADDWDGPGDDADRPGEIDDDRHGVDDPH
jgi:hypothetical protein